MRLAKLATTIRRKLAARPDVFPVEYTEGAITMRRPHDGMTISISDEAMVEVTHPDGTVEVLDAVVDPDWSRKLDRTLAYGGLMPETVEADFGLKIPLTAASGSG